MSATKALMPYVCAAVAPLRQCLLRSVWVHWWGAQQGALSMTLDILVKNVAVWGSDGICDLGIANGRFVSIGQGDASAKAVLTLDAEGRMAVPGFVEPHIHLDKALISERAPVNVSGTLTEAIELLWNIKR